MNELTVSRAEWLIRQLLRELWDGVERSVRNARSRIRGWFERHNPIVREYVLNENDGSIRVRYFLKGRVVRTGRWQMIAGRMVKVSDQVDRPKVMIYGWKETDNGRYDETFRCIVRDKDHYRQLLKEHGCRQKEDHRYDISPRERTKQELKATKKQFEQAYVKALETVPGAKDL
jgi:hypothetical protein